MAHDTSAQPEVVDHSIYHEGGDTGVLLIHGLGGTPIEMRFVAQSLSRAGFTVYCCQLAGHCGTPDDLRRSTREQWRTSALEALDRLKKRCSTIVVGGLSMGSILSLDLAKRRPNDVHGLLLLAPSLKLDGWSISRFIRFVMPYIRPFPVPSNIYVREHPPYGIKDERIRAFVVNAMQSGDTSVAGAFSTPLHSFAQYSALSAEVQKGLEVIKAPTLIIHPREDDMASLENAISVQRRLSGLVELVVLDDSYHVITLDRQRHIVAERAVSFVSSIERRAAGESGTDEIRHRHRSGE